MLIDSKEKIGQFPTSSQITRKKAQNALYKA